MLEHEHTRPDFYKMLGVSRRADTNAIKTAYSHMSAELGADDEKHRDLQKAYDILGDESMRMRYNNNLADDDDIDGQADEKMSEPVTVYTINENGRCLTEKVERTQIPVTYEESVYVLSTGGGMREYLPKDLWNKWLDLCDVLKSRNAIKNTLGEVRLRVEIIISEDGRNRPVKAECEIARLPVSFPNMADENGTLYAYRGESGDIKLVDKYRWSRLLQAVTGKTHNNNELG